MTRKRKYVVEIENHTDSRDNDYVAVWAKSPADAQDSISYRKPGRAITVGQFRKEEGFAP